MTIKDLADSIYLLPVLLDHFKKPSVITSALLREHGITEKEVQAYRKLEKLFKYHVQFIQKGTEDYPLLREGLKQYFDRYLYGLFQKVGLTSLKWKVLDYGCGSGQIGLQFEKDNPASDVTYLDRAGTVNDLQNFFACDFEASPNWYKGFLENFDGVIMSELLHCKNTKGQAYLIRSAYEVLKPKGKLVIAENIDYCMAYRIGKLKKTKVNVLTPSDITNLVIGKFRLKIRTNIFQHQIYVYEKF